MKHGLPVAAIIGRPNVGKSSLFNLLLEERRSIVDEMEGVTRDINIGKMQAGNVEFFLYDTAGYLEKGDAFNALVQEKVRQALEDTDLIIFTVDGRAMHPIDKDLAIFLRRQNKPVIVVANKVDNREQEKMLSEFYELGFDDIMPFSVLHKRGYRTLLEKIEDTFVKHSGKKEIKEQNEEILIALVGKPNVGKSQLLNTILGYDRSIVSPIAGTTRDSLDDVFRFEGRTIRLIDTAGLRKTAKIDGDIEYYSNVRTVQAIERSHVVIQLIDTGEGINRQDKIITEMVMQKKRGLVLAFNKWDLKYQSTDENYTLQNQIRKDAYDEIPVYPFVPIEFISAKEKYKIPKLLETAMKVNDFYNYRVPTSELNEWLAREVRESNDRKHVANLRVYYATQIHTAPPRFLFFINNKENVRKDYARHLENKLREKFDFTGVPIKITYKQKSDQDAENERDRE